MKETRVGTRELKNHLSEYQRPVKAGQTVTITVCGKVIGHITPSVSIIKERMRLLEAAGILVLGKGKPKPHHQRSSTALVA